MNEEFWSVVLECSVGVQCWSVVLECSNKSDRKKLKIVEDIEQVKGKEEVDV